MISDAGRGETGSAKHAQDGREARPEPGRSTVMEEEAPVESERKRRLSWRRGGGGERGRGEYDKGYLPYSHSIKKYHMSTRTSLNEHKN